MLKVLVVDDDADLRLSVASALSESHYLVDQAQDGEEAVNRIRAGRYDLVLLDVNMPRMDGITLVQRLRALPEFKFTPILVLTTESDASMKMKGKEAGATGWIVKPFSPEKLLEVVNKVI